MPEAIKCCMCGEETEEFIEVNFTGEEQKMCKECEEEFWGYVKRRTM